MVCLLKAPMSGRGAWLYETQAGARFVLTNYNGEPAPHDWRGFLAMLAIAEPRMLSAQARDD